MRKLGRRVGTAMAVLGVLVIAYAAAVLFWRDPLTDLYNRWQQHRLAAELESAWPPYRISVDAVEGAARTAALQREVAAAARDFQSRLKEGKPMGRIKIERLDLSTIFVHGTSWGRDLSKGPGHYERTSVPGLGRTTGIAGHRTTFGAPFRHIDDLERDDEIVLELPYGTFTYHVTGHEIVDDEDWSIIRPRGFDTLVLSACHPLYNAAQRWVVFARLDTPDSSRAGRPSSRRDRYGSSDVPAGAVAPAPKPSFAARTTTSS
jgi:sortase A